MVIWARWAVDISLDSSVVEHLTSVAGALGSIPGPAIYFHLYFFVCVRSWSRESRTSEGYCKIIVLKMIAVAEFSRIFQLLALCHTIKLLDYLSMYI